MQELAVAELTRQKERLAAYTTQARFAVAQIYDRASLAQEARRCEQAVADVAASPALALLVVLVADLAACAGKRRRRTTTTRRR